MSSPADMVAVAELSRNPVALTVLDGGVEYRVSAERGKGGKVWLICQCPASRSDGWCRHRLDLISGRYHVAPTAGADLRHGFEQILASTALDQAGKNADRAIKAFEDCLRIFDERRPREIVGRNLAKFTDLVSDLAACASELEDALGIFRRLLERS